MKRWGNVLIMTQKETRDMEADLARRERLIRIQKRDYAVLIGIDPGVETGLAVWSKKTRTLLSVRSLKIHEAIAELQHYRSQVTNHQVLVRIEDARLRRWIPTQKTEKAERGRNQGAGSVKRDCQIWEDLLTDWGADFEMIPPAAGRSKWKADYFKTVTGWPGTTNGHARDAAVLVFGL